MSKVKISKKLEIHIDVASKRLDMSPKEYAEKFEWQANSHNMSPDEYFEYIERDAKRREISPEDLVKQMINAAEDAEFALMPFMFDQQLSTWTEGDLPPDLELKMVRQFSRYHETRNPFFALDVFVELSSHGWAPPRWACDAARDHLCKHISGEHHGGLERFRNKFLARVKDDPLFFDVWALRTAFNCPAELALIVALLKHGRDSETLDRERKKYDRGRWKSADSKDAQWTNSRREAFINGFPHSVVDQLRPDQLEQLPTQLRDHLQSGQN